MAVNQKIKNIRFTGDLIIVQLTNSEISLPVKSVSSRLSNASVEERNIFKISTSGYGVHWPKLDEDLSVSAFLKSS